MAEIRGIVKSSEQLKSTINTNVRLKGLVSVGGVLIGAQLGKRGLKGDKGDTGDPGEQGIDGVGITSIEKTSSAGLVDTYTITFDDGDTEIFEITNGADGQNGQDGTDGQDGQDGHSPVVTASKAGKVTTVFVDGTSIATINDGNDGQNGQDGADGTDGVDGKDGTDGQDGFSPSASVSKAGSIATITITDKDGTTTASISDGSGAGLFIAEFNVTTYADIYDAYDSGQNIVCQYPDNGNILYLPLLVYQPSDDLFVFTNMYGYTQQWALISQNDGWDDGTMDYASTDVATSLINGLMLSTDKDKLDGISSGAEVNVQSDWNQADNTADDFIKNKPTIPSKVSELNNDSGFITTETDPTVPSWAKQESKPAYTASEVGALPDTTTIPTKTSDLVNDSGFITGMVLLSYGSSTWNDFITAYNANKVVYCRASSNANPATGSQTRLAFMAYVNNATTPTSVEFQYYRSVSSHSDSQQGDQVYVYKLESNGTWSVTVREAYSKIAVGTGISKSYSSGTITLSASETDPVFVASAAYGISASDITNWNGKQDGLVSGTNIKTINDTSILGSGDISVGGDTNVQSDWNQADSTEDDYIKNKPTIPSISDLIIVDTYNPTGYDFTASQSRSLTRVLTTHSGYTPHVLKCVCTNKVSLIVYNHYISSGTLTYEVVNRTTSAVSSANFSIAIMWIKDSILGS